MRSPAQTFALVIGGSLTLAGIVGFFYSSAFGSPGETDAVFGILDVNGWHNVVHLVSGLLGLAMAGNYHSARRYALGLAIVYTVVTIWGFVIGSGEAILGFLPVNAEDNVLHLLIALAGLLAGMATPSTPNPTRAGERPPSGFPGSPLSD
jgi:hypothetical protein